MHVELERQRWKGEGAEPDTAEGEGSADAIRFVGDVCARTATVSEDVDVDGAGGAAGGFPSLAVPLSDRIRV